VLLLWVVPGAMFSTAFLLYPIFHALSKLPTEGHGKCGVSTTHLSTQQFNVLFSKSAHRYQTSSLAGIRLLYAHTLVSSPLAFVTTRQLSMISNGLSDGEHEGSDMSLRGLYDKRADSVMRMCPLSAHLNEQPRSQRRVMRCLG
jgi:hypothetical protein